MPDIGLFIVPLPCGCTVDGDVFKNYLLSLGVTDREAVTCFECPWCLATFDAGDWTAWLRVSAPDILISMPGRILLRVNGRTVEFVGQCGRCLAPLVREKGGEQFHVRQNAERVWD